MRYREVLHPFLMMKTVDLVKKTDLNSGVSEDNRKWVSKKERTSNQQTAKWIEAVVKILRLASSDDHDYDDSDYTEMIIGQYLTQLIK